MNILYRFTVVVIFSLFTVNLFAHSLWIETESTGRIGRLHTAKVYFGEYGQSVRDSLHKWRGDLSDCSLWLIKPDGTKERLEVSKKKYFVQADFTPQLSGTYILMVCHTINKISNGIQFEFLASAHIVVGKKATRDDAVATNALQIFPVHKEELRINKPILLKVLVNGSIKAGSTVQIFSPLGWKEELITAADGTVNFTPLWPGKYVTEIQEYNEITGIRNGQPYRGLWQGATHSFDVMR